MTEYNSTRRHPEGLRQRAEEQLKNRSVVQDVITPEESQRLLHELQVHQIELEMQNEELRQAQVELEISHSKFFKLFDLAPVGYLTLNEKGMILEANLTVSRLLGAERSSLVNLPITHFIFREDQDIYYLHHKQLSETGTPQMFELRLMRRDSYPFWVLMETSAEQAGESGSLEYKIAMSDITERKQAENQSKKLEAQLRNTQKIESIGTFAGGIAHDFNNILSAIIGYAELAMNELKDPMEMQNHLQGVIKAGNRARDLVSQIIMFSRHGKTNYVPTMLNMSIDDSLNFLRSIIPTFIEIRRKRLDPGLVMADPVQLRQVMVNLSSNAVQAMGETGGVLEVGLEKVDVDGALALRYPDLTPGPHLRLTISDTGHGMTPEVKERIFDPYFTTRKLDEGSGLGLAVVQGILKKHNGTITCTSTPGKGTTFDIYFPQVEPIGNNMESPEPIVPIMMETPLPTGTEHILFIDDDPTLVFLANELLGRLGYQITTQTSSIEALELFKKNPYQFDLVITDMTMPSMMGDRLSQELLEIRHDIPIILCTGYSEYISEEKSKSMGIREFIMKPYGTKDIAKTIRRVLDEG